MASGSSGSSKKYKKNEKIMLRINKKNYAKWKN